MSDAKVRVEDFGSEEQAKTVEDLTKSEYKISSLS